MPRRFLASLAAGLAVVARPVGGRVPAGGGGRGRERGPRAAPRRRGPRGAPAQSISVEFRAGTAVERHAYEGPLLLDVLALAGPAFDPAVKNDKLGHFVSVTGSDGYRALIAWGELDPEFTNTPILLAITEDGRSLAGEGPRLVVPGDGRGGRYVSGVVSVRLGRGQ